jgi:hypothetical protein
MRILSLASLAIGILLGAGTVAAQDRPAMNPRPASLFERDGQYVVVGWRPAPLDASGKPLRILKLPELMAVPWGLIKRLEASPEIAKTLRKFPDLTERQRQIDDSDSGLVDRFRSVSPAIPLYQMFDRWIEKAYYADFFEINADGKEAKSRLGVLTQRSYSEPPRGTLQPDYKQPQADLVRPVLFCIGGQFFSVFGDCQVAGHVPLKDYPDDLAALRYAGNPLYACSKELPPPLQSCGVDTEGVIWLADLEGHVAFFKSKSSEFVRQCTTIEGASRLLIPRDNQTRSVFAFAAGKKAFLEHQMEVGGKATSPSDAMTLPTDTQRVLLSDAQRVVFLTADKAVVLARGAGKKEQSVALKIGKDEKVWEALYLPKTNEVAMLVGPAPQLSEKLPEYSKLDEARKSWDNLRLHVVTLEGAK